jgi:hypothetical protein
MQFFGVAEWRLGMGIAMDSVAFHELIAQATCLRRTEFGLALAATLITAIASVTGKSTHIFNIHFDIAAMTAVLTTVAGAVLAHAEASRFDIRVTTYLATARRLEDRKGGSRTALSALVNDCENISWPGAGAASPAISGRDRCPSSATTRCRGPRLERSCAGCSRLAVRNRRHKRRENHFTPA